MIQAIGYRLSLFSIEVRNWSPGLEWGVGFGILGDMSRTSCGFAGWALIFAGSISLSGCGLVKAPFRVAGAVVDGVYVTGKTAVDASSSALEKRKERKEKEKAAEEKEKAKGEAKPAGSPAVLPPPDAVAPAEGPIIPLDDPGNPVPPADFLPLPQ